MKLLGTVIVILILAGVGVFGYLNGGDASAPDVTEQTDTEQAAVERDPRWSVIEDYRQAEVEFQQMMRDVRNSDISEEEKQRTYDEKLENRPSADAAIDAARAIIDSTGDLEELTDAAVFLVEGTSGSRSRGDASLAGMVALEKHVPGFDRWSEIFLLADVYTPPGMNPALDAFFVSFSEGTASPVDRATARYHAARRYRLLANWMREEADDREVYRRKAMELIDGLSKGVEDQRVVRRQPPGPDGERLPYPTFVEAEAEMRFLLESLTLGGTLPNAAGTTVAGEDDQLANYAGKVLLIDFWATWCGPCVEEVPRLRALSAELSAAGLEIVSINTDESIDTVKAFMTEHDMPWTQWYVGEHAQLVREWAIRAFPTYMLVDREGTLVATQFVMNDAFERMIRTQVCGAPDDCSDS